MGNYDSLKKEYVNIKNSIDSMIYGSIEIRESNNTKYIYVHFRNNGILQTRYAGEYSDELYNLILNNNKRAKELKSRLKNVEKELSKYPHDEKEIDDKVKLNIDLARKYLVESIYKQSILEGVATTYIDTEALINEGKVNNMSVIDVQKIINLKHAWEFIMDYDVESFPTNYQILCEINKLVEEGISGSAGRIRSIPVSIGGSTYLPPIPFETKVKEDIKEIIDDINNSDIRKAAILMAYAMKTQTFIDGNKRTAVIFGNHYLISHGLGLMVVPVEKISKYKKLLIDYYENKSDEIIDFFINECFISLNV